MSEIEEMEDNDEEELKRKRTQLNVHVETKAQLLKIIEIATRYKKMKTALEAEISKQIVQYVLQVEFDNNKLLVVCKNQICFFLYYQLVFILFFILYRVTNLSDKHRRGITV